MTGTVHKKACDACALRKVKCDSSQPCQKCQKAQIDCTYLNVAKKTGPKRLRQSTYQAIKRSRRENERERDLVTEMSPVDDGLSWANEVLKEERNTSYSPPLHSPTFAPINTQLPLPTFVTANSFTFIGETAVIPLSAIQTYLDIYFDQMYPIWPVVSRYPISTLVQEPSIDPDTYAFVTSLCAATVAQLRLPPRIFPATASPFSSPTSSTFSQSSLHSPIGASMNTRVSPGLLVSADVLAMESLRARNTIDFQETNSIATLLTSFFVHVYYGHVPDRSRTASLYLRESITFAQLLGLHDENSYIGLDIQESQSRRRLFWLLFVTERGNSLQHSIPVVLRSTVSLPEIFADEDTLVLSAFIQLVRLFENFDDTIVDAWNRRANAKCSKEHLFGLQTRLDHMGASLTAAMNNSLEVQKADVLVTREWMRILIWQLSMTHGYLSSDLETPENMQLAHPAQIAKDLLGVTTSVSDTSIYTHGHGMEVKLFEVANSLADVILCAPNTLPSSSSFTMGPKDFLHGLTGMLMNFQGGGDAQLLSFLTRKAGEALQLNFKATPHSVSTDSEEPASRRNSFSDVTSSDTVTEGCLPTPPTIRLDCSNAPPSLGPPPPPPPPKVPNLYDFISIAPHEDANSRFNALTTTHGAFEIPEFDAYFSNNGTTYRLSVSSTKSRERQESMSGASYPAFVASSSPPRIFDIDDSLPGSAPNEFGQAMEDLQDGMGNKIDWNDIQKAFSLNNTINRWMDVSSNTGSEA